MPRPGLLRHRKFQRLAGVIGSVPLALGSLELLWEMCYESGNPLLGDKDDVERFAQWAGKRGVLFDALLNAGGVGFAGFIEPVDGAPEVFQVHDLMDHAPSYVGRRQERERERTTEKICAACGETFKASSSAAKCCSNNCRQALHRMKVNGDRNSENNVTVTSRHTTPIHPHPHPNTEPLPTPLAVSVPDSQKAVKRRNEQLLRAADQAMFDEIWDEAPRSDSGRDEHGDWQRSDLRGSKYDAMKHWKTLIEEGYTARELRGCWILYLEKRQHEKNRKYQKSFENFFSASTGPGAKRLWLSFIEDVRKVIKAGDAANIRPLEVAK